MTTATKPKRPRAEVEAEILAGIPTVLRRRIESYAMMNDFEFFRNRTTFAQAAKAFREETELKMKLREISVALKFAAREKCQLWQKKLKPRLGNTQNDATSEYWDRLKIAAQKSELYLAVEGVNDEIAERIIRLKIATNRNLINGLPTRLKVWK